MWKRFTIQIFISILILITFVIAFTWLVDPFDIFNSPKISHFNTNKPMVKKHSRVHKTIMLKKIKPQVLFLGTSRTECGMDPNNKNLNFAIAYNGGVSGGLPIEYEYYADMAIKNGVKHIIIGVDFFTFYTKDLDRDGFDKELFQGSIPIKYFLSLDVFKSSLKTVNSNKPNQYVEGGRVNPVVLLKIFNHIGSYKKAFELTEKDYFTHHYDVGFCKTQKAQWNAFERILDKAYKHNVKVTLFISPSHARQWEVLDLTQGYDMFEEFKRKLAAINEKKALKNEKQPFVVWDFTGYNRFTTEAVPNDPKGKMKWYRDSSHYTKELGDIVLDCMFDGNFSGGQKYSDFGKKITMQNIEMHLGKLRIERSQWQANHPDDMASIRALKKDEG